METPERKREDWEGYAPLKPAGWIAAVSSLSRCFLVVSTLMLPLQGFTPCAASGTVSEAGAILAMAAAALAWIARPRRSAGLAVAFLLLVLNVFSVH